MRLFLLLILLAGPLTGKPAQFVDHGNYRIHYTAFSSLLVPAEVARVHGISRAENEVVVNITAIREGHPQPVTVTGLVSNLLNQQTALTFQEVRESDAIYYLASHTAAEEDTLRFSVTVTPGDMAPVVLEFLRRYD